VLLIVFLYMRLLVSHSLINIFHLFVIMASVTTWVVCSLDWIVQTVDKDGDDCNMTEILVSEPKKVGDGMSAYIVYKVTTRVRMYQFTFLKDLPFKIFVIHCLWYFVQYCIPVQYLWYRYHSKDFQVYIIVNYLKLVTVICVVLSTILIWESM